LWFLSWVLLWAVHATPKQEKPKRQSKALPHSKPKPNSNHQPRKQPKITDQSTPLPVIEGRGRKHEGEADGDQPAEASHSDLARGRPASRRGRLDRRPTARKLRPHPRGGRVRRPGAPPRADGLGRLPPYPPQPPGRRGRLPGHLPRPRAQGG